MKLLAHLGLPKTGTTFLQQCCFPYVSGQTAYLGKHLDAKENDVLYNTLRAATSRANVNLVDLRATTAARLGQLEGDGIFQCLYSDEMALVDSGGMRWQDKLCQLGWLLDGYQIELVLTVRHPQSALYSLFVELFPTLPRRMRSPEAFILESNQAWIYRFEQLARTVQIAFPGAHLRWLPYHDIQGLGLDDPLLRDLGVTKIDHRFLNEKRVDESGNYVANMTTLRAVGARLPFRRQLRAVIPASIWDRVVVRAANVPISDGLAVPRFSPSLQEWIAEHYAGDLRYLAVEHNIRLETDVR